MDPIAHALGDSGITITLASAQSKEATTASRRAAEAIRRAKIPHVEEVVAAYTAVTVFYDSLHASFEPLSNEILALVKNPPALDELPIESRRHSIPVVYDGPDLDSVAAAPGHTRV
jgi:inhibitor of KinA